MNSVETAPRAAASAWQREFLIAILAVLAVKIVLLLIDPTPRFFLWDSVTYLNGALDGPLPRDRSFLYSFLIHLFAVPTHSLHALVIAQTLAGVATSLLVYVILRVCLALPSIAALAGALLIAIAPSQLFYEHMLMAEAFGGLLWLAFLTLALLYVKDGRTRWIPAIVLCGIVTIAFRLNGTAVIILTGLCLPLLRAWWHTPPSAQSRKLRWRHVALQFGLAALCTVVLHVGYRHIVAEVAGTPPGYIGTEGLFLLGFVAPAVEEGDFRDTGCAPDVLGQVRFDISDPRNRERQLWSDGGIWSVMQKQCPNAESAAGKVAHRAFARMGGRILPMALRTQAQYFDDQESTWRMDADLGRKGVLPLELIEPVHKYFFLDVGPIAFTETLTSFAFKHSRWMLTACFFLSPLLAILLYARAPSNDTRAGARVLAAIMLGMFLCQFLLSPIISFRYLHPFPPLVVLGAIAALYAFRPSRREQSTPA